MASGNLQIKRVKGFNGAGKALEDLNKASERRQMDEQTDVGKLLICVQLDALGAAESPEITCVHLVKGIADHYWPQTLFHCFSIIYLL